MKCTKENNKYEIPEGFKAKPSEINNFRDNRFQDKPINLSELNYKTLVFDKIGSW